LQNELFQVFTIQESELLTDVDVTVSRPSAITLPATAYALAIDNGLAQVKSKPLPYDDQYTWEDVFDVASGVTSVAIEFDGYWDRDYNTRRFNFVTEEYPWLFYVQAGDLYMQYWQDTPELLVTGVAKCAAVRGWVPANGATHNDQGLIIAYLKADGKMYYRSYAIQENGIKGWEGEREVTSLGSGIDDLALFRTNDFRVGFLAEVDGNISWTLSERNWAGMSVAAERLSMEATFGGATIDTFEVEIIPLSAPEDTVEFSNLQNVSIVNLYETEPPTVSYGVAKIQITDSTHIYVQFTHPVRLGNPEISVSNTLSGTGISVGEAFLDVATKKAYYTLSTPLDSTATAAGRGVTFSGEAFVVAVTANRQEFVAGGTFQALGSLPPQVETLGMAPTLSSAKIDIFEVVRHSYDVHPRETVAMAVGYSSGSMQLTDTEVIPV
jgi:hypothetical protein